MEIVDAYYKVLDLLQEKRHEEGLKLLSHILDADVADPFLAIKLTPPLCKIISLVDHKEPSKNKLEFLLKNLKDTLSSENNGLLKTRASLAYSLAHEWLPEFALEFPPIKLSDVFNPSTSYDLFPLIFFQKEDRYQDIKDSLFKIWDSKQNFFKGPAYYSMHRGSYPSITPADQWMRRFYQGDHVIGDPAISFFKDSFSRLESYWRGFHLIRAFLGEFSFSVQGRTHAVVHANDAIEVMFTYSALCSEQDSWSLIGFYIDRTIPFKINNQRSLIFCLGDTISFMLPKFEVSLVIHQTKGKARVSGHVMRSMRPAQEDESLAGCDWAVFLKPLKIEEESAFTMTIRIRDV